MSEATASAANLTSIVEKALVGLADGDISGLSDALADDLVYRLTGNNPLASTHYGKDAFLELFAGLMSQFEGGLKFEFDRFLVADRTVIVVCRGSARTKSGKNYANEYCTLWDFDDDLKVTRLTEFFDSHHVITTILT